MKSTMIKGMLMLPAALAMPAPLEKRALSANDIAVLQLAHYLENLEYSLYSGGYQKFSDAQFTAAGFEPHFRGNLGELAAQEGVHRDTLASVLSANGQTPLPACTYKFPYSDPTSFVELANMITTVGIGAYLGGADLVMDNPTILTTAGAILTAEARHDSFLRAGLGGTASPFPSPFDTAISASFAYNAAHMFVESCPMELPGQVLLPKLTMTAPAPVPKLQHPVAAGTPLSFSWDHSKFFVNVDPNSDLYVAFINQQNPPVFEKIGKASANSGSVPTPKGVANVAFAVLTTFSGGLNATQLSQFGTLAGPAEVVIS